MTNRAHRLSLLLGMTFTVLVTPVLVLAAKPIELGSRRELFVDRHLVETLKGADYRLHHPRPAEISVTLDQPWEKRFNNGISVVKDRSRFLLYYSADNRLAVAVSQNGVHWEKPPLDLVDFEGNRNNNLVGTSDGKLMIADTRPLPEIFLDHRPDVKPPERFKALTLDEQPGVTFVHAWVSADGFAFRRLRDKPIIRTSLFGAFDGFESLFWSDVEQQYVMYLRYAIRVQPPNPRDPNRRVIARMTSRDFLTWTQPQPMTFGDAGLLPPDHHYNNQTTPYFRAPHIYIALSNRLAQTRQALTRKQAQAAGLVPSRTGIDDPLKWLIGDCGDTVMLTTRGGTHYDRLFMEGLVRPGLGAENWVTRSNYTLRGLHPTSRREMSIWVSRHNGQKTCHVRRFVFRTDGLVSIRAPYRGGEFVTRPLTFQGNSLGINFATSAVGGVRVAILSADGKPINGFTMQDCHELIGDRLEQVVSWKSGADVSRLAGRPVRLKFQMRDAHLYSLRFSASP